MNRVLGLDYGAKTVGVAVSDRLLLTAVGLEVIRREKPNKLRRTLARIQELAEEYQVSLIVLGYPKHMDGTIGERARLSEEFAQKVEERCGIPVLLWDERLTTVEACENLIEVGVGPEDRKKIIDRVAAAVILQEYLDDQYQKRKAAT